MQIEKCTRFVGLACCAGILCAMYSWLLGGGILICAALPLAVRCRKLMDKEEQNAKSMMERLDARGLFRGTCFEGDDCKREDTYHVLLREDDLLLVWENDEKNAHAIAYDRLDSLRVYTAEEILKMPGEDRETSLGSMAKAFDLMNNKTKKRDPGRYLVLKTIGAGGTVIYRSFFAGAADIRVNSLGQEPAACVARYA